MPDTPTVTDNVRVIESAQDDADELRCEIAAAQEAAEWRAAAEAVQAARAAALPLPGPVLLRIATFTHGVDY
eukprot:4101813-Lingulodinium_polyedra.AAC.1